MNADGRFAPSPTGDLHLGSLRTALIAWLMARSAQARFLLRIDDLDPQRSREKFVARQLADLRSLGIDWDGEPVRQSQRTELYAQAVQRLLAQGRLYPCFCTRAEVQAAASAPHGDMPDGAYPGTCARLSAAQASARVTAGERHALRLRAEAVRIEFDDLLAGRQGGIVDDFVVVRSDGVHAYQLAVVVDDAEQGIGQVVRGVDLAPSTPRQILLQQLLGLPTPSYAHVPLVLSHGGQRLAKRDGAVTLKDRHEPPSMTLAWLAHSIGLAGEAHRVASARELLAEFQPSRIPTRSVSLP
ncbi:MAG: tRNA glutamyl-Q(34) synthetase GluQRS [Solirubrobacteraceae bacterium]